MLPYQDTPRAALTRDVASRMLGHTAAGSASLAVLAGSGAHSSRHHAHATATASITRPPAQRPVLPQVQGSWQPCTSGRRASRAVKVQQVSSSSKTEVASSNGTASIDGGWQGNGPAYTTSAAGTDAAVATVVTCATAAAVGAPEQPLVCGSPRSLRPAAVAAGHLPPLRAAHSSPRSCASTTATLGAAARASAQAPPAASPHPHLAPATTTSGPAPASSRAARQVLQLSVGVRSPGPPVGAPASAAEAAAEQAATSSSRGSSGSDPASSTAVAQSGAPASAARGVPLYTREEAAAAVAWQHEKQCG